MSFAFKQYNIFHTRLQCHTLIGRLSQKRKCGLSSQSLSKSLPSTKNILFLVDFGYKVIFFVEKAEKIRYDKIVYIPIKPEWIAWPSRTYFSDVRNGFFLLIECAACVLVRPLGLPFILYRKGTDS